jgi:hypothetical protein
MRGLSGKFMISLKSGLLKPVLERVKKDDTLMLGIRDGYFNIYYRGGNLLRITEKQHSFNLFFDKKYDLSEGHKTYIGLNLPEIITDHSQLDKWVLSIASLKELMDFWFSKNSKMEREFQQLVERENNRSPISGDTEYFITDIEFADSSIGARFDILAIKWPASKRKDGKSCTASFIEMKYGDAALSGNSGLIKHIKDMNTFLTVKENYFAILETMTTQFNQLDELGLMNYNHCTNNTKVQLSENNTPEFIFLIANHNPRSKQLKEILIDPEFINAIKIGLYNLRFYVANDAGYGMHEKNMLSYEEYVSRI